tara:strand:+ start:244 stop:456 length:213 start_codon:yes stop_codon:yes gene_type:complete
LRVFHSRVTDGQGDTHCEWVETPINSGEKEKKKERKREGKKRKKRERRRERYKKLRERSENERINNNKRE